MGTQIIPSHLQGRVRILNTARKWIAANPNAHKRQIGAFQRIVTVYEKKFAKMGYTV